jgi:glycosyltransferase involved in cell wall biosynthesis
MSNNPRVSIGLPVYNGENYLAGAVESLLAQTYTDFELIICDNASTDGTEAICREYALRDNRVRYQRNAANLGASPNHNLTVELARGDYYKLAAHDDIYRPSFLEKCVEVLDREPEVVLAYTKTHMITGSNERVLRHYEDELRTGAIAPHIRFGDVIMEDLPGFRVFGVMRTEVLCRTPLWQSFGGADKMLVARMALLGPFREVPEFLFVYRWHAAQSSELRNEPEKYYEWWDPANAGKVVFPTWRYLYELLASVSRAPLEWVERMRCYAAVARWVRSRRSDLVMDFGRARRLAAHRLSGHATPKHKTG